mmetsp:Transcript_14293/g.57630  ORF Transcript_14293/g.57630 Transcript_14293/m.57630 type:complete len:236 (+) Transcript_14293:3486-4193(+)
MNTIARLYFIASSALMKKVLSPISEARIKTKEAEKPADRDPTSWAAACAGCSEASSTNPTAAVLASAGRRNAGTYLTGSSLFPSAVSADLLVDARVFNRLFAMVSSLFGMSLFSEHLPTVLNVRLPAKFPSGTKAASSVNLAIFAGLPVATWAHSLPAPSARSSRTSSNLLRKFFTRLRRGRGQVSAVSTASPDLAPRYETLQMIAEHTTYAFPPCPAHLQLNALTPFSSRTEAC